MKDVSKSQFLSELSADLVSLGNSETYEDDTTERLKLDLVLKEDLDSENSGNEDLKKTEFNEEEKSYLKKLVGRFVLSPSSLNTYLECPRKFLFSYLLKIPRKKEKPLYLGKATHYALERFFRNFDSDKSLNTLLEGFEEGLKKEYLEKEEFTEALEEGKKILSEYFEHYKDKLTKPLECEYGFFDKNVYFEDIKIHGVIDRIDQIGNTKIRGRIPVRVVDYKTGRPKSRNEIMGETKNSDGAILNQIGFYKLLSTLDKRFPYEVSEVAIDFLRPNTSGYFKTEVFEASELPMNDLIKKIKEVSMRIRELEFDCKCEECRI